MTSSSGVRYEIRGAARTDEEQLLSVAKHLDSVNLPNDRSKIRSLIEHSVDSFEQNVDRELRKYIFVLYDREADRIAGTSMIVAKLGRRGAPYIYLDVLTEEKYTPHLDKHFNHTVLRTGYSYDGPTELGGLIVHPDYRRARERLGLSISYVRFLYIACHRDRFEGQLLAELLPPLEADGTSHLWEAFGRRFTDMTYREADRRSSERKDFVRDLFPSGVVYATLLDPRARAVIGEVGAQTKGVERMLRRIGFRYAERVDPFDGGPHFIAKTDEVTLVQETRHLPAHSSSDGSTSALVARDLDGPPYYRAVLATVELTSESVGLAPSDLEALEVDEGATVDVLPLR